ncbi:MAG: AAA family ATPase [Candidatus Omnitrophota bacterium]
MNMKDVAVGKSDFKEMITGNYYYVDKSLFIKDVIDRGDAVILLPRPRRFGKTLNMTMLGYFYDCCPEKVPRDSEGRYPTNKNDLPKNSYKQLFERLLIHTAGQKYLDKMGKHPVIFLTFKTLKERDWNVCYDKLKQLISDAYTKHMYLLSSMELLPHEKDYFKRIIDVSASIGDYENSLEKLMIFLSRYYDERAVILIDEYDAPIHAGFNKDYYEDIIEFMRNFLGGALKDTGKYLEKGVLTGVMRIARESIFSGLNNPGVYTLLSEKFDDKFGFTEREMETILKDFNLLDQYEAVQQWYNGYTFGRETIYNPWSIISFLANDGKEFSPYWINTSSNDIIEFLLSKGGKELKEELEQLIRGESIEKVIDENIVFKDIYNREDLLWSFLLMAGYLKQSNPRQKEGITVNTYYTLSIPNKEVREAYTLIVQNYFSNKIGSKELEIMLKALMDGHITIFEEIFSQYVASAMSVFDTAGDAEKVYHAFVMGLLLWVSPAYQVKSNRESGYGRYDIMIIPNDPSKLGYIIEFKKVRKNETVKLAIESALKQIEEKKYETDLIEKGITNIKKLAIVFKGKDVYVKEKGGADRPVK